MSNTVIKILFIIFICSSCASEKNRVILNYKPYIETSKEGFVALNEIKENSKSFERENFSFELEEDYEIEQDLVNDLQNINERKFFSNLGKRIKIDHVYSYPLKNFKITSFYGKRTHPINGKIHFHKGVDLKSKSDKIYSIKEGRVVISRFSKTYGNIIAIRHANGLTSIYAHNKVNYVKKGEFVKRNKLIGIIGNTGYVTGKHLHFELRKYNKNINPMKFFDKKIIN
jgi:murein DD-endopeptidase MepM/ murein hydrolase activator NlpD